MRYIWHFHRRFVLVASGMLVGLLVLLGVTALALRAADQMAHESPEPVRQAGVPAAVEASPAAPEAPTVKASDVAYWEGIPHVKPAVSRHYPAIAAADRTDPTAYARAFATRLFTRDYRGSTRAELVAWAQYEVSPLQSTNYPESTWTKVLVDSLTDPTWDSALDTPIPLNGPWLAMRSQGGWQEVSDVVVTTDPTWEQHIADGYEPPDPLATVRNVSLTVTQHTRVGGQPSESRYAVSLQLQLGSSPRHSGYAMAVTNNYVVKAVG